MKSKVEKINQRLKDRIIFLENSALEYRVVDDKQSARLCDVKAGQLQMVVDDLEQVLMEEN